MNHIVIIVQEVNEEGEVQRLKEVTLDEMRLPEQPENVLDELEERAIDAGREVAKAVMEIGWEELDNQAVAEARSFSP